MSDEQQTTTVPEAVYAALMPGHRPRPLPGETVKLTVRYDILARQHLAVDETGAIVRIFPDRVMATDGEAQAFAEGWVAARNEADADWVPMAVDRDPGDEHLTSTREAITTIGGGLGESPRAAARRLAETWGRR